MFKDIKPVGISTKAAAEIKKIMQTKGIPADYALRVGIKGAGCGGAALMLGFDKAKETDLQYEVEQIPVLVDKRHTMYVIGKVVDFHDGADARGFMFAESEPNN
ncbi:MAG TPA: iron-sulfur cluster biosynthesis family protein [Cyclobacteriaceae bacterium]|nr:iron-sulfur cluster biosynthesis family protein [Cyclobacteriaceae bacterium]